ncbi:MAG: hypothetical protein HQL96_00975 [Magnetococcales bacterium]|nr:hypothetical protein [Magnetococcales bacterium]
MNDTMEQRWNLLTGSRRTRSLFYALRQETGKSERREVIRRARLDIDCWHYPWSCVGHGQSVPAS